jgi:hypothetical protein
MGDDGALTGYGSCDGEKWTSGHGNILEVDCLNINIIHSILSNK